MTDKLLLKKDHLTAFLRKLRKDYLLVAPLKNRHGDTLFSRIDDLDAAPLDLDNQPQNSLKEFLLPQQETLFKYQVTEGGRYEFTDSTETLAPTIYFAVRSCDVSALLYMDVTFLQANTDPHYLARRQEAVIIGLNCNQPQDNCFCNATRSGPFLEYGSDLQLTDLGDRFLVEVGRAKGEAIVRKWPQFFSPAAEEDKKLQYQAFLETRGGFARLVHADQTIKRLNDQEVPESVWSKLSQRCQDCGGCAYVCPTCTCFTISDQPLSPLTGLRVRAWDACTFSGFTRMAGGHNPVDRSSSAIRQRFMHKLHYDVKSHGRPSCVGCGRCVNICFGGTDILRFMDMACQE
jgi:ferredoxin